MITTTGPIIEVFADIWCPFTHVGLRAVKERARSGRGDVAIWVRAWPLELVNGAPLDPAVTKAHADDLRNQVAPNLFQHLDVERFPARPSMPSHWPTAPIGPGPTPASGPASRSAMLSSKRAGTSRTQPCCNALRAISGSRCPTATDRSDVVEDWGEGVRRGVLGSPHFFCGDTDVFCPSLDITRDAVEGMSIVKDVSRLTEFLAQCLAQPGPAEV